MHHEGTAAPQRPGRRDLRRRASCWPQARASKLWGDREWPQASEGLAAGQEKTGDLSLTKN